MVKVLKDKDKKKKNLETRQRKETYYLQKKNRNDGNWVLNKNNESQGTMKWHLQCAENKELST